MKKTLLTLVALAGLAMPLVAQTPKPVISDTTKIALDALQSEYSALQKQQQILAQKVGAIQSDVAKQYPGHHLNMVTFTIDEDTAPGNSSDRRKLTPAPVPEVPKQPVAPKATPVGPGEKTVPMTPTTPNKP